VRLLSLLWFSRTHATDADLVPARSCRHSSARRRLNGLIPERIGNLTDIVHVAAGDNHSFAVKKDGTVYGWGLNLHKQLGIVDSSEEEQGHLSTPVEIESLSPAEHDGHKVVQIGGGTFHSVFLFDNGEVYVCGGNDEHELGLSDDNIAITQQDKEKNYISPPVKLDFPQTESTNGGQEDTKTTTTTKIVKLAIGTRHSFALGENGDLYGWGLAGAEQLGCNAAGEETVPTPKRVTGKTINEYRVRLVLVFSVFSLSKCPLNSDSSRSLGTGNGHWWTAFIHDCSQSTGIGRSFFFCTCTCTSYEWDIVETESY
jgi:alpha-tubulin suppressor-like RCC1 family protein